MITKIKVRNFKSLADVDVELGAVNVFIGANGSGKSNLLEAIGVLSAAAFGRVDDESLQRRGVRPTVPLLFKSAFPREHLAKLGNIFFSAANRDARYDVALSSAPMDRGAVWCFESETLYYSDRTLINRPSRELNPAQGYIALKSVELPAASRDVLDLLGGYAVYCANTATLRGLSQDQQLRSPVGLSGGRLPEAIAELQRAASQRRSESLAESVQGIVPLIDWAESVSSAPSTSMSLAPAATASRRVIRFRDRFMEKRKNVLSGYEASEGALYILFAAILALHPKAPRFLALDNFDQALNPRMAMRLSSNFCDWVLKTEKRQVLLTSHSPAVLDGLPLKDDRVRLFTVDRNTHGHTVVNRVELTDRLLSKAEQGWTLSRLWVNGLIGGVPNV